MRTRLPTKTPWPSEQPSPIAAPPHTWTQCQMRLPAPMRAPSSTMAVGWMLMGSVQGQRHAHAVARRPVDGGQQRQGLQAFAAVGLGFRFAAQGLDDVVVVQRVAEAVDR